LFLKPLASQFTASTETEWKTLPVTFDRHPHGSGRAARAGDANPARKRHDSGRHRAIAGLIASQFTARLLQSLLFGVSARDVAAYAAVVAGVAAIGLLADYIPARRASRVDPTNALRFE
jgi:hypothetical protein